MSILTPARAAASASATCPVKVIAGDRRMIHIIDQEGCIKCGTCLEVCPFDSIVKVSGETVETPAELIPIGTFGK